MKEEQDEVKEEGVEGVMERRKRSRGGIDRKCTRMERKKGEMRMIKARQSSVW